MKGWLIKQVDSRVISVGVGDCEDIPIHKPYVMHPTGMVDPERVDMRWENSELVRLSVSGRRIKKDGTIGLGEATTYFVWNTRVIQETQPDWLQHIVRLYDPKDDVR